MLYNTKFVYAKKFQKLLLFYSLYNIFKTNLKKFYETYKTNLFVQTFKNNKQLISPKKKCFFFFYPITMVLNIIINIKR